MSESRRAAGLDDMSVEVVHALPDRAIVKAFRLAAGATVAQALALAARDPDFRGVNIAGAAVGVFGAVVARDRVLRDGERIEIYRPLALDPKAARRERVRQARSRR